MPAVDPAAGELGLAVKAVILRQASSNSSHVHPSYGTFTPALEAQGLHDHRVYVNLDLFECRRESAVRRVDVEGVRRGVQEVSPR